MRAYVPTLQLHFFFSPYKTYKNHAIGRIRAYVSLSYQTFLACLVLG